MLTSNKIRFKTFDVRILNTIAMVLRTDFNEQASKISLHR